MKLFFSVALMFYSSFLFAGVSSPSPSPSPNSDTPTIPSAPSPQNFDDLALCNAEAKRKSYNNRETGSFLNPCDSSGNQYHPEKIQSESWSCTLSPSVGTGTFKINYVLYRASISVQGFSLVKYTAPAGVRYAGACGVALYSTGSVAREVSTCLADNSALLLYDSKKVKITKAPKVLVEGRKTSTGTDGFPETKVTLGEQETTTESREAQGNRCVVTQKKATSKASFDPIGEPAYRWNQKN